MSDDAQFLAVSAIMAAGKGKVWVYKLNKADGTYAEIQTLVDSTGNQFGENLAFSRECKEIGSKYVIEWKGLGAHTTHLLNAHRPFLTLPSLIHHQATATSWPSPIQRGKGPLTMA